VTPNIDRINAAAARLQRTVRRLAVRDPEPELPPLIDRVDGKTYFVDAAGVRYRVHDVTFAQHRNTRVPLGSPTAHYRIFVARSGEKRSYQFTRGELHDVTVPHLERQLRVAGYLGTTVFDPSDRTPVRQAPIDAFQPAPPPKA